MKARFHSLVPLLIAIFLFFYSWNVYLGGNRWKCFFLSDSNGYYAYLPAVFIYHDLNFSFIDTIQAKSFPTFTNFDLRVNYKGNSIDKWFCGTALAMMPFFLIGHGVSLVIGADADGYGIWNAWGVSIAALTFCFIGLMAMRKLLKMFFQNDMLITIVLLFVFFGTNLFYYSSSEPAMSHVYSFAFINLFVLSVMNLIRTRKSKYIIWSAIFLAFVILIRPVNGFIIFIIPFLCGSKKIFRQLMGDLFSNKKAIILSIILFLSILFIQLLLYKFESGEWIIYSYAGEKMNLFNPHLFDFLFSYKKGLFVYLPLIFVSLFGLIYLRRENRWQYYSLLIFVVLLWYVLSSWWDWGYGGSFGTRPIVEYLFIFAILLGYAIKYLSFFFKKLYITLCILCLVLCQVQTYQYRYYHIHWSEMNKERYWKAFMRIDLLIKMENPNGDLLR